ncbi:hypothetical protein [Actinoallomurus sp. NPDC052274]|uniref:hypothetical protein n=1 Tax=Actinoallomurus sp. NPDC052274 TaxID=3155420 RepID=UPI003441E64C
MNEQEEGPHGERGVTKTPSTPAEANTTGRPATETPAEEEYHPPGGTSRPEDLSPDDFE